VKFSIKALSPESAKTGCVVAGVHQGGELTAAARRLDQASKGALKQALRDISGRTGSTLLLRALPGVAAERVLLVGLGEKPAREAQYRDAVRAAGNALKELGAEDAALFLVDMKVGARPLSWNVRHAVLGASDAFYRFDELKTQKKPPAPALTEVILPLTPKPELQNALREAMATASGTALARTLGNLPANICTPSYLAEEAKKLAREFKLGLDILERRNMEKLGMGALLSVARASHEPPKLVVLRYSGSKGKKQKPLALVGKGITFDTGGISLKPAAEMDEMKFDMSGAAAVLGTLRALAEMRAPVNVVGIIPACENMPGGHATKPGDVVTTLSGQTVEILNTDAEGRLILCDALSYAERFKPDVVDIRHRPARASSRSGMSPPGFRQRSEARRRHPRRGRRRLGPRLADAAVGGLPGAVALELRRHGEHRRPACGQRHRGLLPRALRPQAEMGAPRYRRHGLAQRPREGFDRAPGAAAGAPRAAQGRQEELRRA
jgi:leucyl aminopeptidase